MSPTLFDLSAVLADLYPTASDLGRVAVESGLDPRFLRLTGKPVSMWNAVLKEATRRGKVSAIVAHARSDAPDHPSLRQAADRLTNTTPGAPSMSLPPPGTPITAIDGPARKELRLALLEAFPQPSDLAMLVEDILNERFVNISLANDMPTRTFDLISWAKARGRLSELVLGASSERPTGAEGARLRAFANRLAFPAAAAGGDETIQQKDVPFENPTEWIARFTRGRAAVARIEPQPLAQSDTGFGTGFLVGPDLLLTNFHIIDSGVFQPEKVVVRFDCEFGADGKETKGRECKLAANWNVASSLRVANGGLDFALIRLREKAADDTTSTGKRGWLQLHPQPFVIGRPVCILQHPAARPMKLAWGKVTAVAPSPVQVGYDANTEGGSSGSPCFSAALDVVALHHFGGPDNNRGVTATALWTDPVLRALTPPPAV